VKLCSSQISVAPRAGFSVTGDNHSSAFAVRRVEEHGHHLVEREPPDARRPAEPRQARQPQLAWRHRRVLTCYRRNDELHDLTGGRRVGELEGRAAPWQSALMRPHCTPGGPANEPRLAGRLSGHTARRSNAWSLPVQGSRKAEIPRTVAVLPWLGHWWVLQAPSMH
jgi:hypothetical protein